MQTSYPHSSTSGQQPVLTVSELNATARYLLEEGLNSVSLIGEISNLARPRSGHLYFSLKDEQAQIRCALFRNSLHRLAFNLENGQQVIVQARATVYETRGDFQLTVNKIELAGHGALQIAFKKLQQKLDAEGLFAENHKQPLPTFAQSVGVITSPSGAAIRDILTVLQRRSPSTSVILYPCLVQGSEAATEIASAIETANQRKECDVLLLARGGGSLEDLWPFNEEKVARAIYLSELPIISGVGHEIDFTIADFVADKRASTPSAAAELVSLDQAEWLQQLQHLKQRLSQNMQHCLRHKQQTLDHLEQRLRDPRQQLIEYQQRLQAIAHRLQIATNSQLQQHKMHLELLSEKLDAINPLKTLQRGYAITEHNHKIIHRSTEVTTGDLIKVQLAQGKLTCTVNTTEN